MTSLSARATLRARGALALAALLVTAACRDGGVGPDRPAASAPRETKLIATAGGKSAANDVLLVQAIAAALGGGTSAAPSRSLRLPNGIAPSADITYGGLDCTYQSSGQDAGWFTCPEVTLESMTIHAMFALIDTAGQKQSAYDDTATVRADVRYWARGTLVNPSGAATIDRERTLRVDSLQNGATRRIFGGVGTNTSTGPLPDDATQTYVLNDTTTADSVVVGVPFSANVWPLSGRLITDTQLDISQGGTHVSTTHRRVVITFNGTQLVEMKVDDATTYTLDLATGDLTPDP